MRVSPLDVRGPQGEAASLSVWSTASTKRRVSSFFVGTVFFKMILLLFPEAEGKTGRVDVSLSFLLLLTSLQSSSSSSHVPPAAQKCVTVIPDPLEEGDWRKGKQGGRSLWKKLSCSRDYRNGWGARVCGYVRLDY